MATLPLRRTLTPLIHVLGWGLLGLTFLLFQPYSSHMVLPPQYWVKQGVLLVVWIATFYFTAGVATRGGLCWLCWPRRWS
jgi:two-component system LytT family sensor kinase